MDIRAFETIVRTEKSARNYLKKACQKNGRIFCHRCHERKVYRIRRDRFRCARCGYEFSAFTGRWIGSLNIPAKDRLRLIKLFELEVIMDVSAASLLGMTVKTVRRGTIVYTDKFKSYDSLMFCGYRHLRVDHGKRFAGGKVYINGLEGFWSYAKERLIKFHGVSKDKFPLYIKEMEFRYNHRDQSIFPLLTTYLCDFVANPL